MKVHKMKGFRQSIIEDKGSIRRGKVENGAKVNATEQRRTTPLIYAAVSYQGLEKGTENGMELCRKKEVAGNKSWAHRLDAGLG